MNLKALKLGQSIVVGGHSTIMFFSKSKDYQKALKDLEAKKKDNREEYGYNGDWQDVGTPDTSYPYYSDEFPDIDSAKRIVRREGKKLLDFRGFSEDRVLYRCKVPEGFLFLLADDSKLELERGFEFISKKKNGDDANKEIISALGYQKLYKKGEVVIAPVASKEERSSEFKTLEEAKEWAYRHVNDYASYALKIKSPEGWLFVADIHH